MDTSYIVYTIPQWAIFASLIIIIYAWIEKKNVFNFIGLGLIILLGIYSLWALYVGLVFPNVYFPDEFPYNELTEEELPRETILYPVYWLIVCLGVLALVSFILELFKKRAGMILRIICCVLGLTIFFLLSGILKV